MDFHVSKPIVPDDLFDAIERVMRIETQPGDPEVVDGPGFDTSAALARVGGDVTLLKEIVELLLAEAPKLIGIMRSAMATGERTALARAAYDLKGAAGNCAARDVEEAARLVEALASQSGDSLVAQAIGTLSEALERLRPALESALERLSVGSVAR